ncbi:TMAO reductase system sensor histidine kinase/response regulator TorS [uncultured Ferrimonas sp.]|uniref:TMAO reductase system sensor histidine kinase/response regulator TorS n=1 Tax=uncultured Ferrimonas sp. TaxID=432640 RepID=UPI00262B258E|nr:TMAO reductase system sensor histidine kinase/response regulator TorS [uncultured Ferrimonas sp.]
MQSTPVSLSIAAKLLLAFLFVASLSGLAAWVGWLSLDEVRDRQQSLNDGAIPTLNLSRSVAELGGRVVLSGQFLSQVNNSDDLNRASARLNQDMEALYGLMEQLSNYQPQTDRHALINSVNQVQQSLNRLTQQVQKRIAIGAKFDRTFLEANQASRTIADLVDSQLANAETAMVARSIGLYQQPNQLPQQVDDLIELDLLQLRRLSELQYNVIQLRQQLVTLPHVKTFTVVRRLKRHYQDKLEQLALQLGDVADPESRSEIAAQVDLLQQGQSLYNTRQLQLGEAVRMARLSNDLELQFDRLNQEVAVVLREANQLIRSAQQQTDASHHRARLLLLLLGAIAMSVSFWVVWKVVYRDVVYRVNYFSSALMRLSRGDLSVTVTPKGKDELTRLADAIATFKATAIAKQQAEQELRLQHQQLEQTVSRRTAELQIVNDKLNSELAVSANARAEAEQASRAKTTFLATISHEIRTPMNGILGTAELLGDEQLNPSQRRFVNVIRRSGESLLDILNDVLDYSKIDAGHIELDNQPFALATMVTEVRDTMAARAQAKGLDLIINVDLKLALAYVGDRNKLKQVLMNLVNNAIKFTEQGSIAIDVELTQVHAEQHQLRFSVSDSGIGIPSAKLERIFAPFQQAQRDHSVSGTGLGLAISQRLVEAMNGSLSVSSQVDRGSCFEFQLRLSRSTQLPPQHSTAINILPSHHILVIEDNPTNQLVIEGFLRRLGQQFDTVADVASAKQQVQQRQYDLALVDINLPDGDGSELQRGLKQVQQQRFAHTLPCIAMSAHVFNEQISGFIESGFDDFVAKPIRIAALAQVLSRYHAPLPLSTPAAAPIATTESSPKSPASTAAVAAKPTAPTPAPTPASSPHHTQQLDTQQLDTQQLQQDLGVLGLSLMQRMAQQFGDDSDELLLQLESGGDWRQLLHRLKGGAASVGLIQLSQHCAALEQQPAQTDAIAPLIALQQQGLAALQQWLSAQNNR